MNEMLFLGWQCSNPLIILPASFIAGIYIAWICKVSFQTDKVMALTCALLPGVVAAALMTINGSLGAGIAILGVFGLVRFRSLPGQGTDILAVFYAMAAGLMTSTGYLLSAMVLCVLIGLFFFLLSKAMNRFTSEPAMVRITLPEDVADFQQIEAVLNQFGKCRMLSVKTTHMGTLYDVTYEFQAKTGVSIPALLEELRKENNNLPVSFCSKLMAYNG